MTKRIKPAAQGAIDDAAERWLRENDPCYASSKRKWIAPSTDALSRCRSETNVVHPTLENMAETIPKGDGSYRRGCTEGDLEAVPAADEPQDDDANRSK